MVRTYKKKLGGRTYKNYSEAHIETALSKILVEGWTLRRASVEYRIPYGTLNNRYHGRHAKKMEDKLFFQKTKKKPLFDLHPHAENGDFLSTLKIFDSWQRMF